jgi:hypothetical protein
MENKELTAAQKEFTELREVGPFALDQASVRDWITKPDHELVTKFRTAKNLIFQILDIKSFSDISIPNKEAIAERAYINIGRLFKIDGNPREVANKIRSFGNMADSVIDKLRKNELSVFSRQLEIKNEVKTNDPIELLLITLDNNNDLQMRFEAKRKLVLMVLAASVDLRERKREGGPSLSEFQTFLNKNVWSIDPEKGEKIGHTDPFFLLSDHDEEKFECKDPPKKLTIGEAAMIEPQERQKLTQISRRKFKIEDTEYPVYVTPSRDGKEEENQILKMLRKGKRNPASAVDDDLGFIVVLESYKDVNRFHQHLTESSLKRDDSSLMLTGDLTDKLISGEYTSGTPGSSKEFKSRKFFAEWEGMEIEFILHTTKTYINYLYQRGVSHPEYEVNRLFETGVAELLFPESIYGIDMEEARTKAILQVRKKIEE